MDHIVSKDNMWRVLVPYFKDIELLKTFYDNNCENIDFVGRSSAFYSQWTPRGQEALRSGGLPPRPKEDETVRVCADTFGGIETHITYAPPGLPPEFVANLKGKH